MAVYSNGIETKKRLVLATYYYLTEHDASDLRVRTIAEECDCAPSAIYRHFKGLDYLIAVASVRFLHDYTEEYDELMSNVDADMLKTYIDGWEIFNKYAFERPDVYYRLFWGIFHNVFEYALQDYYQLFPFSQNKERDAYFYLIFLSGDMESRDYMVLHACANANVISEKSAVFLSKTNPLIAQGILNRSINKDIEERMHLRNECNLLIKQNVERSF